MSKVITFIAALLLCAIPAWGQVASRDFVSTESDYISYGNSNDLDERPITVAFWTSVDASPPDWQNIISQASDTDGVSHWLYLIGLKNPAGATWIFRAIWKDGSGNCFAAGDIDWVDGTSDIDGTGWHWVMWTMEAAASKIYVDGVLEASNVTTELQYNCLGEDFYIGASHDASGGDTAVDIFYDGLVSYVHVYQRVLSLEEGVGLMNCPGSITGSLVRYWPLTDSTTQYDQAGSGHNGTNNGTAASTDGPPVSTNCAGAIQ